MSMEEENKALFLFREYGFRVYTLLQIQNLVKLECYKHLAKDLENLDEAICIAECIKLLESLLKKRAKNFSRAELNSLYRKYYRITHGEEFMLYFFCLEDYKSCLEYLKNEITEAYISDHYDLANFDTPHGRSMKKYQEKCVIAFRDNNYDISTYKQIKNLLMISDEEEKRKYDLMMRPIFNECFP